MRPGHIVVSALVAALGLAAVFVAQHRLEQRSHSSAAAVAAVPQEPTKTVVVATRPLRFGTEIKSEHLAEVAWPAGAIPSDSIESISDLLTAEGRRAVLSPIEANEPVLSWKVTGPGERATLSAPPEAGARAMSVRINDVLGVAGFVLPGDRVDIMLTRDNYTYTLLQNIKVRAIDHLAGQRADQPKSGRTATVEVNTVDAQKLTHAQMVGSLSIALVEAIPFDGEGEEETAVDLLAENMEESFKAIEKRIDQLGQEFKGTQPIDTEAMPFDPNARVGGVREYDILKPNNDASLGREFGGIRQEYDVPKLNGDASHQ